MTARLFSIALLGLVAGIIAPATAAEMPTATQRVESLHAALLDNMKHATTRACSARADKLRPVVEQTFDFPFLARQILRKQWETLDAPSQQRFLSVLHDEVIVTYASRFAGWSGEAFVTTGEERTPAGNHVVHAQLTRPADPTVRFDYVLHAYDGNTAWRVVNVIADGVSDLALRASQYQQVIRDQGFAGLLQQLTTRLAQARAECP